jgi:hypothetical protein
LSVQSYDKLLVGVAVAAAQLMIQMGQNKWKWRLPSARGVQSARKSDTIGSAGYSNDDTRRSVTKGT